MPLIFHVIRELSFYRDRPIDAFHATMFHGRASRGGKQPSSRDYRLAYDVDRPLRLHKNAFEIAHVFAPEFKLVVSSAARDILQAFAELEFAPVIFETLFSYPYRPGDFSFWKDMPDYRIQQQFIDEQKDDRRLHADIGAFFELVTPPFKDLRDRFSALQDVTVEIGPTEFDDPLELSLNEELLDRVPIFSCGDFVVRDDVFNALAPFIDWNYFIHAEGRL